MTSEPEWLTRRQRNAKVPDGVNPPPQACALHAEPDSSDLLWRAASEMPTGNGPAHYDLLVSAAFGALLTAGVRASIEVAAERKGLE